MMKTYPDVAAYMADVPQKFLSTLEEIRALIKRTAPQAKEQISYGIPYYKHHYALVAFGHTKTKCSFYTTSPGLVKELTETLEAAGLKFSGSTIHLNPGQPLPEEILVSIIQTRMAQNEQKAALKGKI